MQPLIIELLPRHNCPARRRMSTTPLTSRTREQYETYSVSHINFIRQKQLRENRY